MERDLDELSAKYIEASDKLEQWDIWWQEGSTNTREAEPIDQQTEGLKPIIEEERQQQPTTPFVIAQPTIPQEFLPPPLPPKFAHINFPKRANESDESSHTGMDPQAIPAFAPTTPPSVHKHTLPAMPKRAVITICRTMPATREKLIRSRIITLAPEVAGSAMHLLCRCTLHLAWAFHHLLLLSPTLVQAWELRALHYKLARNKVE